MDIFRHRGLSVARWVTGVFASNVYLLVPEEGVEGVIIDAGGVAGEVSKYCRSAGITVGFIILTHNHFDHTLARRRMKKMTGAKVLAGEAESKDRTPFVKGGGALRDGDVIHAGPLSLTAVSTPGHTRGGICLYSDGALFTGDTLFAGGVGRTDLKGGDFSSLAASLKKLMTFPEDTAVYPGHGPPSTIGREKRENPFIRA